ncbi:hypothetical protein BG97_408 [Burkholderia pseudomallei 7894]|nr:hypothetical protein BG97_408 [Burkholderia pseudomallei 7894]
MSPPARACARFGGFARGRWRIAMGGEGTRAKAANRRGANRGRPRRGAAFVRSDRGDRDDCGSCGSCGGGPRASRCAAAARRTIRVLAKQCASPFESARNDAFGGESTVGYRPCGALAGMRLGFGFRGGIGTHTHTRGRAAHASPLWARSIWKPNIEWRDICRRHGCGGRGRRSMPPAQQTRCTAAASERGARRGRQSIGTSYAARACRP